MQTMNESQAARYRNIKAMMRALEHFSVIFPLLLRARRIVHTVFALAPRANCLKNALEPVQPGPDMPAPINFPSAHYKSAAPESKYDPLRLNANAQSRQSESCAEQHHNVPDAYCDRMTLAHPDHSLVIVFAVRLPELLAAQHTPAQGNRCVQNKGREHRQRKSAPPNAAHRSDISQCAGQKTE